MRKDLDALKLLKRGEQAGHLLQTVLDFVEDEPLAAFRQIGDQGLRIDDTCVNKEYMRKAHGSVSKKVASDASGFGHWPSWSVGETLDE
ncbi:hypothetical protein HNP49_001922 [Pseudomonas fluvialis]|uniref:Uncharacterized protein n=1 Tax=Pseudomonas fluvialis TaxID=1793966 RepID=A0A7X0BRV7_9PSED|nr:hypothetical protein [Pseudomonas fluvialis]MBB6341754.1 hypothetical protein [Pseudomonas fluvialis]